MARVSIRKEELERVLQVAERMAKRTNSKVVIAHERLDIQDAPEAQKAQDSGIDSEPLRFD